MSSPALFAATATPREIDRQALKLTGQAIKKIIYDRRWWFTSWNISKLLKAGYSEQVIAKAKQYDLKQCVTSGAMIVAVFAFPPWDRWRLLFMSGLTILLFVDIYRFRRNKLSPEDDKIVVEELMSRFGKGKTVDEQIAEEHPLLEDWNRRLEKRALLWRVDRFLSGKPMND
jgi:hypothetical protein